VRGCPGFESLARSLALALLGEAAKCGLAQILIDCGVLSLVHHAFGIGEEDWAAPNPKCSGLTILSGIASSNLANARLVVREFGAAGIVQFFVDGCSEEKFAAADLVVRMTGHIGDSDVAEWITMGRFLGQLADLIGSDPQSVIGPILPALLSIQAAAERGTLYPALGQQFNQVIEDADFVAAIGRVITTEEFVPEVREMAAALIGG
jgi:hypothetical protein